MWMIYLQGKRKTRRRKVKMVLRRMWKSDMSGGEGSKGGCMLDRGRLNFQILGSSSRIFVRGRKWMLW
jgi:hypothetical protein